MSCTPAATKLAYASKLEIMKLCVRPAVATDRDTLVASMLLSGPYGSFGTICIRNTESRSPIPPRLTVTPYCPDLVRATLAM
eukprot:3184458-Rhodomonas_salina.1